MPYSKEGLQRERHHIWHKKPVPESFVLSVHDESFQPVFLKWSLVKICQILHSQKKHSDMSIAVCCLTMALPVQVVRREKHPEL